MALKIWLDNSMKKINTSTHKPVIFLNGDKYRIDKAYTFVNGVRHQIWGETGVQIDYIASDGVLNGGDLYAIGDDWMVLNYNLNVLRVDISNLSNPTLIQSAAWGSIKKYNAYQSTLTESVFYANGSSISPYSYNKLLIEQDGSISVGSSAIGTGLYFMDGTNTEVVTSTLLRQNTAQAPNVKWACYGSDYYFDSVKKHTSGTYTAGNTSSLISGNIYVATGGSTGIYRPDASLQIGDDKLLVNLWGNKTSDVGLYEMTSSSLTKLNSNNLFNLNILDGSFIVRNEGNDLVLNDSTSFTELYRYTGTADKLLFLGKIGNNYFVIETVNNSATLNSTKLKVLDSSDLSVVLTRDLPDDPFNENNGNATFWTQAVAKPMISTTGFLGVSSFNNSTLSLRVVRISDIL